MRRIFYTYGLAAGMTLATAVPGLAQAPQHTTATYEDWTVRCDGQAGASAKTCEMVQATQVQGQSAPVTQVAIGRPVKTEPMRIVFLVPVNVYLPGGLKLVYDDKQPALSVSFSRCIPAGCFADTLFADDLAKRLRGRTDPGRIEFKDASQRDVHIPVSFKGFSQAYDDLLKE